MRLEGVWILYTFAIPVYRKRDGVGAPPNPVRGSLDTDYQLATLGQMDFMSYEDLILRIDRKHNSGLQLLIRLEHFIANTLDTAVRSMICVDDEVLHGHYPLILYISSSSTQDKINYMT
jgi:hypothetical protein